MTYDAQHHFTFTREPAYCAEDFFVSSCNDLAYRLLVETDNPPRMIRLCGGKGSGKTHLALIWAQKHRALRLDASMLNAQTLPRILEHSEKVWVIEDLEKLKDEAALFHAINAIHTHNGVLLLTSCKLPTQILFQLQDLRSRLALMPIATLAMPDDDALRAVLIKQFADRQLRVGEDVISYLVPRMERSFASVHAWVEKLDDVSLSGGKKINPALVRQLMEGNTPKLL